MPALPDRPEPAEKAESWLDERTQPDGNRPKGLEDRPDPTPEDLRLQQQREMQRAMFGTEGQTHGAVLGSLGGALVGLLIGLAVGFLVFDAGSPARWVAPLLATLAGSTAGFVYFGGRTPELENETMTAAGEPGIGTTPRDPGTDERGR